jgi:hypothetical protein
MSGVYELKVSVFEGRHIPRDDAYRVLATFNDEQKYTVRFLIRSRIRSPRKGIYLIYLQPCCITTTLEANRFRKWMTPT